MRGLSDTAYERLKEGWCIVDLCEHVSAVGSFFCAEHDAEVVLLDLFA